MAGSIGDSGASGMENFLGGNKGSGALPLLKPIVPLLLSLRFCGVMDRGREVFTSDTVLWIGSGLEDLGILSSVGGSNALALEGLRDKPASDAGGLDLELAALLMSELDTESSDEPESDGV